MSSSEKPTAAFILSLIAGIFALIESFLILAFISILSQSFPAASAILGVLPLWILICGAVIFIGAVMLYQQPERSKEWGIIVLIFSIFCGINILGIVGGALAIGWTPAIRPSTYLHATIITRVCPVCKRVVSQNVAFCPYCGTRL